MNHRIQQLLSSVRRRSRTYDIFNMDEILKAIAEELPQPGFIAPALGVVGGAWLPCDGSQYLTTDYPELFEAIGYRYGGQNDVFNVPDTANLILMGDGNIVEAGSTAGSGSVTLTQANLPSHTHQITDPGHGHAFTGDPHGHGVADPGHDHATTAGAEELCDPPQGAGSVSVSSFAPAGVTGSSPTGVTINNATATGTVEQSVTGITAEPTGGGAAFPIIPPVLGVKFAIKI